MKYVLEVMKKQKLGTIVNTASVGGIRGVGNQSGYAASKHGVVGLTRNSGIEYGQYGISIKAIAPGAIMTPMVEASLKQMGGDQWEEAGKEFVSVNPMKRFGKPEEVHTWSPSCFQNKQASSMPPSFQSTGDNLTNIKGV